MGMATVIRSTMMVITTINSTKVKPRSLAKRHERPRPKGRVLPIGIWSPIRILVAGFGVDVEDVLAAPAGGLGVVLIAAHPPFVLIRERVDRDVAQELHHLTVRALRQFYPRHQHFQAFGVTVGSGLDRTEVPRIAII